MMVRLREKTKSFPGPRFQWCKIIGILNAALAIRQDQFDMVAQHLPMTRFSRLLRQLSQGIHHVNKDVWALTRLPYLVQGRVHQAAKPDCISDHAGLALVVVPDRARGLPAHDLGKEERQMIDDRNGGEWVINRRRKSA